MTDREVMRKWADDQRNVFAEAFRNNWGDYFRWLKSQQPNPPSPESDA